MKTATLDEVTYSTSQPPLRPASSIQLARTVIEKPKNHLSKRDKKPKTPTQVTLKDNDRISKNDAAKEKRRAQIRRATRAYRERKETTLNTLGDRVNLLENVVEQMNDEFLDFSEDMLELATLKPALAKRLRDKTEKFLKLAKEVEDSRVEQQTDTSSRRTSSSPESDSASMPVVHIESIPRPITGQWSLSLDDVLQTDFDGPSFRNGFYPSAFSRQLFYYGLTLALMAARSMSTADVASASHPMFKFALKARSPQEIETSINVSLNLGAPVDVIFMHNRSGYRRYGPPARSPSPLKLQDSYLLESEPAREDYLDINAVEQYLRTKGAYYFDSQVVQMVVPFGQIGAHSSYPPQPAQGGFVINETSMADSHFPQPQVLEDLPFINSASNTYLSSVGSAQMVTLDNHSLMHNLSNLGVCIGTGVGFLPSSVDRAIAASLVMVA